jgi:hypothetical protein
MRCSMRPLIISAALGRWFPVEPSSVPACVPSLSLADPNAMPQPRGAGTRTSGKKKRDKKEFQEGCLSGHWAGQCRIYCRTWASLKSLCLAVAPGAVRRRNGPRSAVFLLCLLLNAALCSGGALSEPKKGSPFLLLEGVLFLLPQGWEPEPPASLLRAAQWQVQGGKEGEWAEVVIYSLPSDLYPGAQAVLGEWQSLFLAEGGEKPKFEIASRVQGPLLITRFYGFGTYRDEEVPQGVPPRLRTSWGLLGGVIESEHAHLVVRWTGPASFTDRYRKSFERFLAQVRPAAPKEETPPAQPLPTRVFGLKP